MYAVRVQDGKTEPEETTDGSGARLRTSPLPVYATPSLISAGGAKIARCYVIFG